MNSEEDGGDTVGRNFVEDTNHGSSNDDLEEIMQIIKIDVRRDNSKWYLKSELYRFNFFFTQYLSTLISGVRSSYFLQEITWYYQRVIRSRSSYFTEQGF